MTVYYDVTKINMKYIILTLSIMTASLSNAQILSVGLFRNQILNTKAGSISNQGIELSNTHFLYTVYAGVGTASFGDKKMNTRNLGIEYTPTGFHQAYIANRLAPFVGAELYKNSLVIENNIENVNKMKFSNTQFAGKIGIKYSNKRVITSCAFIVGKNEQLLSFKLSYLVGVTHKCLKKRMLESGYNMAF